MEQHCDIGDLFIEFRKNECEIKGKKCEFCQNNPSICVVVKPVSRPYPDYDQLPKFHYKSWAETPIYQDDGTTRREIDDFNPRVHIKKEFESGNLKSTDLETVKEISRKYDIEEDLVLKKLTHLEYLRLKRQKRAESSRLKSQREK